MILAVGIFLLACWLVVTISGAARIIADAVREAGIGNKLQAEVGTQHLVDAIESLRTTIEERLPAADDEEPDFYSDVLASRHELSEAEEPSISNDQMAELEELRALLVPPLTNERLAEALARAHEGDGEARALLNKMKIARLAELALTPDTPTKP